MEAEKSPALRVNPGPERRRVGSLRMKCRLPSLYRGGVELPRCQPLTFRIDNFFIDHFENRFSIDFAPFAHLNRRQLNGFVRDGSGPSCYGFARLEFTLPCVLADSSA